MCWQVFSAKLRVDLKPFSEITYYVAIRKLCPYSLSQLSP